MTPTFTLIGQAFETYFKKENFVYLLKITLVQLLVGVGASIPLMVVIFALGGLEYLSGDIGSTLSVLAPLTVIFTLVSVVVGVWLSTSLLLAVSRVAKKEIVGVKQTLSMGWKKTTKYFLVSLFVGLLIVLGFLLLFIPGVIFMVWFSFAQYYVIEEGGVIEAIRKSKNLVKGHFWRILFRFIVFGLLTLTLSFLLSFIPVVGSILIMLIGPFSILLNYLLFVNLKDLRKA